MKNRFLLFLLITATVSALHAQQSGSLRGAEYCFKQKTRQALNDMPFEPLSVPQHTYDVLNYALDLDLMNNYTTPYPSSFSANVTIQFRADSSLNFIDLNAVNSSLTIDSVKLNAISFTHLLDKLTVNLDRTYNPGEVAEVKIYYRHNDVSDGAIYVSGGFFFTDCEPEGARKWFPCYDSPSDKATIDIHVKVPQNVKLGSNGRLQDSIPDAGAITYHWISRDPVATYLVVLTSKVNYKLDIVQWNDTFSNEVIPIRFYYNSNEDPTNIESIIGEMTSYYSAEFGDHPFEKNGFCTLNSQFIWGGMENQTLTSLCPGCWQEALVAHEFAHQWFGDMITCGTWADIFLNEGFATWSEAHWIEHTNGYDVYKQSLSNNADNYLYYNPGWAISDPSWAQNTPDLNTLFNLAVTYNKGSCVMHQLRYVMGDSLFFAGLKAYTADTNLRYKSATIPDFEARMESVSGQDLSWFFDEWIYKPNHPTYRNVYAIKQLDNGKWQLQFTAKQQGSALDPYWQMPLELKINFINLTDTVIKVFNSYNQQIFTFQFDVQPVNLLFDPNKQILLKKGNTMVGTGELVADNMELMAYPDPFTASTSVKFTLVESSEVSYQLFDATGRKLKSKELGRQSAGEHTFQVDGTQFQPGVYHIRLIAGDKVKDLKIIRK
jgi:aminopeptidase N